MTLRAHDFDYSLPEELIARYPAVRREESRMMVVDRKTETISHHRFGELLELVGPDELFVLNDAKVMPARIRLEGRAAELLLLQPLDERCWRCLVRPGKWFSLGREFVVGRWRGKVIDIVAGGDRVIRFDAPIDLEEVGELPLPPYLHRAAERIDQERYQTVYAKRLGAVAAPTAGLHFTEDLLRRVPHVFVTLEVGVGTFKPVKTELLSQHQMHRESFEVSAETAAQINRAAKVLAVGTTTVRTLESLMLTHGMIVPGRGQTEIFIHPPFEFRRTDSLLTNFHLPKSTLLMLVSAFAGRELILAAYHEAIAARYRFFSYGDCMLIR
jgi:S-adenosylmethionine:tRNA ribosyltransferase-isomerase